MKKKSPDGRPSVLVVDDNKSIINGFKKLLSHKYHVLGAKNGFEALDVILDNPIHCVVLDVKMHQLDGFKVCKRIRKINDQIPIIFYTAFHDEHNLQDVINKYKPEGYVEKGQQVSIIENLIDNAVKKFGMHLKNRRMTRELEEANQALKLIIKNIGKEKAEIEQKIKENIQTLIMPEIAELRSRMKNNRNVAVLDHLLKNLDGLISATTQTLSATPYALTPAEIRIASLITGGCKTKEIASIIGVSSKTVEYHRDKIREKLDIKNKKTNLRTALARILNN